MKWLIINAFIVIGLLAACSSPALNEIIVNLPDGPQMAKVVIPLPASNARAVGFNDAQFYTNYFEVFFRRTEMHSNVYSASATIEEGKIEITIPAGNFDILLLAGYRHRHEHIDEETGEVHIFIDDPLLLASSYVLSRSIVSGAVNQIVMELKTIDIDVTVPNSVYVGDVFTVEVEYNIKNPLLYIYGYNYLHIDGISSSSYSYLATDLGDNRHRLNYTIVAPMTPRESNVSLYHYINPYYLFGGSYGSHWNVYTLDNSLPSQLMAHYTIPKINFISGQVMPEVEIIITWSDE